MQAGSGSSRIWHPTNEWISANSSGIITILGNWPVYPRFRIFAMELVDPTVANTPPARRSHRWSTLEFSLRVLSCEHPGHWARNICRKAFTKKPLRGHQMWQLEIHKASHWGSSPVWKQDTKVSYANQIIFGFTQLHPITEQYLTLFNYHNTHSILFSSFW